MNKIGPNQRCQRDCKSKRIVQLPEWAGSFRDRVIRTQTVKRSNVLGVTLSKSLLTHNHQHKRVVIWSCRDIRAVEERIVLMADHIRWHLVKILPLRILGRTNHPWQVAWSRTAIANWIRLIQDPLAQTKHNRKRKIGLKIWRWRTCRPTQIHWTSKLAWVVARIES